MKQRTFRPRVETLEPRVVLTLNTPPIAVGNLVEAVEDQAYVAGPGFLLANDTDADDDALAATLVSGPAHGTLAFNANSSFRYVPAAGYSGPDQFVYTPDADFSGLDTFSSRESYGTQSDSALAVWQATESSAWDVIVAEYQSANGGDPPPEIRRLPPVAPLTPAIPPMHSPFDYPLPHMRWPLPEEPFPQPPVFPYSDPILPPGWLEKYQDKKHLPNPFKWTLPGGGRLELKPGAPGNPFKDPGHPAWREIFPRKYKLEIELPF